MFVVQQLALLHGVVCFVVLIMAHVCSPSQYFLGTFVRHLGERLEAERTRLGLSQTALAEACGVGKRSQQNYESGERLPDAAYLAAFAGAGGDLLYVVTGSRSPDHPALDAAERVLLESYRRCGAAERQHLIATGALLSAGMSAHELAAMAAPGAAAKAPGAMKNTGKSAVQVGHAGGDVNVGKRGR